MRRSLEDVPHGVGKLRSETPSKVPRLSISAPSGVAACDLLALGDSVDDTLSGVLIVDVSDDQMMSNDDQWYGRDP
jgi:hypothetical protein